MSSLLRREPEPAPANAAVPPEIASRSQSAREDRAIVAIAYFKIAKGVLFLLLAVAAFQLVNHDVAEVAHAWLRHLGIRQESVWLKHDLEQLGPVIHNWRLIISPLLLLYSAVFFTEGFGLLTRKPWAEWMTVIVTGSLIPLELYEVCHKTNLLKILALVVNAAIVWFLIVHIRRARARESAAAQATPTTRGF